MSSALSGKKVFLDTSAIILFLHGKISEEGKEIFKRALIGNISLITTSRCVDELIFKEMVILAKEDLGIKSKTVEKLRKNPEIVKALGAKLDRVIEPFLKIYNVEVLPVKNQWVLEVPKLMQKYGLFGNDALIIRAMKSRRVKYLLTADRDFEQIEGPLKIKVIKAI